MCECIDTVNARLASFNTRLTVPMTFALGDNPAPPPQVMIRTDQIETGRGKKRAVGMFATFCPFCGVKYAPEGQ